MPSHLSNREVNSHSGTVPRRQWAEWTGAGAVSLGTLAVILSATGDRLLFLWPGYLALAAGFFVYVLGSFVSHTQRQSVHVVPVISCLGMIGYVAWRAYSSEVAYFGRKDILLALAFLLVYVTAVTFPVGKGFWRLWLIAILAGAAVHVCFAVYQHFKDPNFIFWTAITDGLYIRSGAAYKGRLSGGFNAPTHFAALLTSLCALTAGTALVAGRFAFFWAFLGALFAVTVPFTLSRSGMAGMATVIIIGGILAIWLISGVSWKWACGLAAVSTLVIALAGWAGWVKFGGEFQTRMAENNKGTKGVLGNSARPAMWRAAIEQAKVNPLTGTGSGSYEYFSKKLRDDSMPNWLRADSRVAHNEFLQFRAEYGNIGALFAAAFVSCHLLAGVVTLHKERRGLKKRRWKLSGRQQAGLTVASTAGLSAGLVHALADFNLHIPATLVLMAVFCGVLARRPLQFETKVRNVRVQRWSPFSAVVLRGSGGVVALGIVVMGLPLAHAERDLERGRLVESGEAFSPIKVAFAEIAQRGDPSNPDAFYDAARWRIGALDAARNEDDLKHRLSLIEQDFVRALHLYPQFLEAHLALAKFLEGINRLSDARHHYEVAMSLAPGYGNIRMTYAGFLERQGELEKAIEAYEHAGKARHYHDGSWKQRIREVKTELERRGFLKN